MASSRPTPVEVFEQYRRTVEAYSVLETRLLDPVQSVGRESRFFGMTTNEVEAALERMSAELDVQINLLLIASCEAWLRTDFEDRVRRRRKDAVSRRFRLLERSRKAAGQRGVRLEEILKVWAGARSAKLTRALASLFFYRHWIAHGRYWVERKSGLDNPDPYKVWDTIRHFLESLTDDESRPARPS